MFAAGSSASDTAPYDFHSEDNISKWQTLLVQALQKVQRQVHPSLSAKQDALHYIEKLILQLLGMLCNSQPHTVQDVEERVQKTFPHPIDKWAIGDAQNALDRGKKKSPLVLPVIKIHPLLVREVLGYKVDMQVTSYIVAVLEYIAADILKLTGNYVKNIKHQEIMLQDIKVAMCADKVLMDMFFQDDDDFTVEETDTYVRRGSPTYEEIVKDLILEETQYMRDLNMIIKVFRAPFVKLFPRSKDLDVIFSNILEIQELTASLLSSLEDTLEATEENGIPLVGACFEEMAEGAEFDVYERFTDEMVKPNGRERLNTLIQRNDTNRTLQSAGRGFKDAVKYVLPKLLLGPIYHCLHYFEVIKALIDSSNDEEDKESLEQTRGLLNGLRLDMEHKLTGANILKRKGDTTLRFQGRAERELALNKMNELQKSIDGWEGRNIGQSCNEFIMEGVLYKYAGRRQTERYVFLFDGLLILTKQNTRRTSVTGQVGDYKLKEKFNVRKIDIVDREDVEELKHTFEIQVTNQQTMVLKANSADDKNNWMAALVSLQIRSNLERMLDSALKMEEKQHPLRLPSPSIYRFAEADMVEENIVFEESQYTTLESPLIKGGTLLKLVERLTYHTYADPKFVKTFLTTYRTFSKPEELLSLLIERFEIPDPPMGVEGEETPDLEEESRRREQLKRFRKEYSKPVQFRVLNVLRHWVDQHWYDFENNEELKAKLTSFLRAVKGKSIRKWVESIDKIIARRQSDGMEKQKQITYQNQPPITEWHLSTQATPDGFDLMTLHPVEIARQVTILEFDLYRAVKSSEMVGSVWMKKNKNITSANLLKMIQHSTRFTFWLEKCIIEAENFEERICVVSRILEVMMVFQELNNFNGILEVVGALNSAPVHRLEHTLEELKAKNHKLIKAFDEAQELNHDRFKRYLEKLRSIDPPCVPFLGLYLTNILLTEEGNPDFLPNRPEGIINFKKRRKVAEIMGEIQQYQNQPYCLSLQQEIRTFFENLKPLADMSEKEFNDYLYEKSLEIEPRNSKQPAKFEKQREYPLKSPGIKRHSASTPRGNHPMSLSPAPVHHHHGDDVDGDLASLASATPPTPSTPRTPPPVGDSVFATVVFPTIGTSTMLPSGLPGNSPGGPQSLSSHFPLQPPPASLHPAPSPAVPLCPAAPAPGPPLPIHGPKLPPRERAQRESVSGPSTPPAVPPRGDEGHPPPLPPRRTRDSLSSVSDNMTLSPAHNADLPQLPPPLPPRRTSDPHGGLTSHTVMTLPPQRTMSVPGGNPVRPVIPIGPVAAASTLPRPTRDLPTLPQGLPEVNGEEPGIPQLPPKTYRNSSVSHMRKQSS